MPPSKADQFYPTRELRAWYSDSRSSKLRWRPVEGFLRVADGDAYKFVPAVIDEQTGVLIPATDVLIGTFEGATSIRSEADSLKAHFARTHQRTTTEEIAR